MIRRKSTIKPLMMLVCICTIIVIAIISLGWPSTSLAKQPVQKTLTAASSNNFPPINLLDDEGRLTGFGRELAEAVVKAAGGEVRNIHSSVWGNVLKLLASGEADFIHDTGYMPDRTSYLEFSEPILSMPEEIFVLNDRFDIQSLESLADKRVACVNKHITHLYLMKVPEINCHIVKTPQEGLNVLLSGEVDAFIYPRQIVLHYSYKLDVSDLIKVVGEPVRDLTWHMVVKKGNTDVLLLLNRGIARVKTSGEYQHIYDKWFGENISKGYSPEEVGKIVGIVGGSLILVMFGFVAWTWTLRRKVAQAAVKIKESEERYRETVEASEDLITIVDAKGRFTFVNDAAHFIFGIAPEECIGLIAFGFVHPLDREQTMKAFDGWIENKETAIVHENRQVAQDGTVHHMSWKVSIHYDSDGGVASLNGIARDITERKRAEENLIHYREHLEELVAERTAEVQEKATQLEAALKSEKKYSSLQQQFVSLVSHEFRTPLSIIDGAVQRIVRLKDKITPEQLVERGDKIRHAVERMVDLIDSTLYAENLDQGNFPFTPKDLDLKAMIAATCEYQAEISPDHQIRMDIEALPPTIFADGKLLKHAFQNLLSNAVKYSLNSPLIEVKGWTEGDFALLSVKDCGVGIPANDLPNMFQRFFRAATSNGIHGTGVGLSVCKQFIEMHGGDIGVESVEGEGTTFTVKLPIAAEETSEMSA